MFAEGDGDSFSIETLPDGERIAVINEGQDAFKGQPRSRWAAIARRILLKKFKGQTLPLAEGDLARITKEQAEEYAYPRNQYPTESSEFAAKMRAAPELDHLLETAEFSHWGRDTKHHPEATFGYDYFNVRFIVDGHLFEGLINIANSEKGRIFYDITKIREIPDTSGKYAALMARSSSAFGNLSVDRIHGNTEKVNTNFDSQKSIGRSFDELVADIRRQEQIDPVNLTVNDPLLNDIRRLFR